MNHMIHPGIGLSSNVFLFIKIKLMGESKKNLLWYYYRDWDVISRAIDYMDDEWYANFLLDPTKEIRMFDSVYETAYNIFYSCISQGYEDSYFDESTNAYEIQRIQRLLERYVDIVIKILLYEFWEPKDFEQDTILATEKAINFKAKRILKEIIFPCLENEMPAFNNVNWWSLF